VPEDGDGPPLPPAIPIVNGFAFWDCQRDNRHNAGASWEPVAPGARGGRWAALDIAPVSPVLAGQVDGLPKGGTERARKLCADELAKGYYPGGLPRVESTALVSLAHTDLLESRATIHLVPDIKRRS
jgi:hypothetical protein